jgi:hypothetical protein
MTRDNRINLKILRTFDKSLSNKDARKHMIKGIDSYWAVMFQLRRVDAEYPLRK